MDDLEHPRHALGAHMRELAQVSASLQQQLIPPVEATSIFAEMVQRAAQPLVDEVTAITSQFAQLELPRIELPEIEHLLPDLSGVAAQIASIQEAATAALQPAFEQLRRTFEELPPRIQEALLVLGEHGWYLDPSMPFPDLWELESSLSDGNVDAAEEVLCAYYEDQLSLIEANFTRTFPNRARLVQQALSAHRKGEYSLAIPVLLAQADGVCFDVTSRYLFMKDGKRPQVASYLDQIAADGMRAAVLSPLMRTLPINASAADRPDGSKALNRHQVMHGESLDYDTKPNSLRAISLLNYVAAVLAEKAVGEPP